MRRLGLPVASHLVGDSAPAVRPGDDPAFFGTATLSPTAPVEARSYHTFRLVYTVGRIGIDDTGAIRVAFRMMSDIGMPQTDNPQAPNYLTASSDGQGHLDITCARNGGERPWKKIVTIQQSGGYLKEGDRITIVFGNTSQGSPGQLMPTMVEEAAEFRVSADVQATGEFVPLPEQLCVPVVAGPVARWVAVLPTLRRPGEPFRLGLRAEDLWGNPRTDATGTLRLEPSRPIDGLPEQVAFDGTLGGMSLDGLSVAEPGMLRVAVFRGDERLCETGPLVIRDGEVSGYWGDLHGQSGETIGLRSVESYFEFARDIAFLDAAAHQGNDFQIRGAFWEHLNRLTAEMNDPGRFVTFPGYEWSANTAVGGDHNVFFRQEGRPIRRCSHALLDDRSDLASDPTTLTELYAALQDEDCVLYAHVGGRYANVHYDHDPRLEVAVEVHSDWGSFPWMLTDSLAIGRRVGVVANSDCHDARPGASAPGSGEFGAYGGLTCFLTDRLDRDGLFDAMRKRHTYGTSGCRMHIDLGVALPAGGTLYERDPKADPETPTRPVDRVMMGDIVSTTGDTVTLDVDLIAHAGIERVEIWAGTDLLQTVRPYGKDDLGDRFRVIWSGAEYRGRGRTTHWRGRAHVDGPSITRFETIAAWNHERTFEQRGSHSVVWVSATTGNFSGFDVWLDGGEGRLSVTTNRGDLALDLADIGLDATVMDAGGLDRRLTVQRLPSQRLPREISIRCDIPLATDRDTPIWIAVTTEDGFQAWTSPVYVIE
jgi:hypothetical protein